MLRQWLSLTGRRNLTRNSTRVNRLGNETLKRTRRMILSQGLLAPFATLMFVCGTLVYYFGAYLHDGVEDQLTRIASDHRRFIDQFLDERASDLRLAASSRRIEELSHQARLVELFRDLQAGSQAFFDLGVFDEEGNHVAYVGPFDLAGKNYAEAEWFEAVREKGLYISDVFLGYRKIPHFIIAVRRDEGDRSWYLRATIDTLSFNDLVESIRVGKAGEAYLVNRKGVFQTKQRSGGKLMESDPDYGSYLIDDDSITSFSAGKYWRQRHLYATGSLKHTDWVLVVRQEVSDAYGPLGYAVLVAVIVIIMGGTAAVIMAYILASGLARRLTLADMEKREMKTQLIIAGKLAEVGEMSAGVAHEINNPLQVMKSEQTMIEDLLGDMEESDKPPDPKDLGLVKESVEQIGIQIERCKKITRELLRFARKNEVSIQPVKIQEFLPPVVSMIEQRALVEDIRIIQELDPGLPAVMSDPNQLQQVFLNLLNNAMYALRDNKDSGQIRIGALRKDAYIGVSVADDGCGIPPENMEKIFLPFFTTKPVGQGTGLGLSSVYGILNGLGGEITVISEAGGGTVFTVLLPLESPGQEENKG